MAKRKKSKDASVKTNVKKTFLGIAILVFLMGLAAVAAHHFIGRKAPPSSSVAEKKSPRAKQPNKRAIPQKPTQRPPAVRKPTAAAPQVAEKAASGEPEKAPTYEIYPSEETPERVPESKPPVSTARPRVAIIIDDLGYDLEIARQLLDLDVPLTFSMFPHSPNGAEIARMAEKKGIQLMLHLPMEPNEYPRVNPGPGTLFTHMTPDELLVQLESDINDVPNIRGVNNHMGSKMTASDAQMNQIFTILKKRNLFFIDSRTTTATLARQSAHLLKVPFAERDVFIDHETGADFIRKQLRQLVKKARLQGTAVGIGHPHRKTQQILKEMLPEIQKQVELVPASAIVGVLG